MKDQEKLEKAKRESSQLDTLVIQREIKFRAYDLQQQEVLEHEDLLEFTLEEILSSRDEYPLVQYVEVKDKNSKEIYEGDVIKVRYYPMHTHKNVVEYYRCGVVLKHAFVSWKIDGLNVLDATKAKNYQKSHREKYEHPTMGDRYIDKSQFHVHGTKDLEVIGNIYENPELVV